MMVDQARLTSRMLVDALRRKVQNAGGFATIVQRGNDQAGAILVDCRDRGENTALLERYTDFDGKMSWRPVHAPHAAPANWTEEYARSRADSDSDLWWIELDIADAARFADELFEVR
jgi:hypothetical protein